MSSEAEEALEGGNLSTVVRVGDTVRRPSGPWTTAVHALLDHLAAGGFDAAPHPLGRDEKGREVLSFVPGETVGSQRPWPDWCWSDDTLIEVGRLLRRYHEAVADFVQPPGTRWRLQPRAAEPGERICHNDVAPYNLVRRPDGRLALIDWDVAGPGEPLDDLAFAACAFAPMHPDEACGPLGFHALGERPRRLRLLVESYGLEGRGDFVDRMLARLAASVARITAAAEAGDPAFQRLIARGRLEPVKAQRAWIRSQRAELESALSEPAAASSLPPGNGRA